MRNLVIVAIVISFASCSQSNQSSIKKSEKVIKIDLSRGANNDLKEKLNIIDVKQLETSELLLIGSVKKAMFKFNRYFIQDLQTHSLLVFGPEGNFIQRIGAKGRGEGEFIELRDFSVTEDSLICLLSYQRILMYTLNGRFVKSVKIKNKDEFLNPLQMASFNSSVFYLWQGSFGVQRNEKSMPFLIYTMSSKGKMLENKYLPLKRIIYEGKQFNSCYNGINLRPTFGSYTIYKIANDSLFENVHIDFGGNTLDDAQIDKGFSKEVALQIHDYNMNSDYAVGIDNFHETKDYYYFTFIQKGEIKQLFFSKKTGGFVCGGMNPFTQINCTNNNKFVCILEPFYLKELGSLYADGMISKQTFEALEKIKVNINSNPILLIYELNGL